MPRRGNVAKREVLADPIYNSKVVTRLVNYIMLDGKKGVAQEIVYDAFDIVKEKTGAKVRGIELSLLQRCGAHLASETDIEEAVMAGRAAVENAVVGITDKMVAFERETVNGHYACKTKLLPLTSVANYEKKIPLEWINDAHNGVKQELIDYVLPLIQGEPKLPKEDSLPRFAKLKKVLAK
jgi:6-phosphofructokinase